MFLIPGIPFLGVATFGPIPHSFPDLMIYLIEGAFGDDLMVKIDPAPNDGVQDLNETFLGCRFCLLQDGPELVQ